MSVALLAGTLAGAGLATLWWRDHRRLGLRRSAFFDDCDGLLDDARLTHRPGDLPLLEGRYRGFPVRVEPVVEAVAVRKLPSLWLSVSVTAPLPIECCFDLMMRTANVEFWSPAERLRCRIETPPGWPEHALLRTDAPAALPPLGVVEPHVAPFHGSRDKELLFTPNGVRLVHQVDEGRRSTYLLLRQAEFECERLPPDTARALLDRCLALHADIAAWARARDAVAA